MSTPDLWARATAATRAAEAALDAWNTHPGTQTGQTLSQALTEAATAVHALYSTNRRPVETGCPQHPHGAVDLVGLDTGEGPCLACNQNQRRLTATTKPRRTLRRAIDEDR